MLITFSLGRNALAGPDESLRLLREPPRPRERPSCVDNGGSVPLARTPRLAL